MALIIEHSDMNEILGVLSDLGYATYKIGDVTKGSGQIILR